VEKDSGFEMASSNIRFGKGVTREVGMDFADRGNKNVLVVTDEQVGQLDVTATALESLEAQKINYTVFDGTRIEPTDESLKEAIEFARPQSFDGFLAIGGGSVIDTAKTINLYTTYPADFLDYVNAPIGKNKQIPGVLKPLIAIPTTAGTGSEATGRIVFDLVKMRAKTGISSRLIRPTLGIIDPENTRMLPPQIAASTGFDVLSHAIESYTAIPFDTRKKPSRPSLRPPYQGSNPISDIWALEALRLAEKYLFREVEDIEDDEARGMMMMAAGMAGVGFGNAGCHLPHAMSYPVSGMVKDYIPEQYQVKDPLIPHGMSVILNAPAAFRFTASSCPERHLQAAQALGADISRAQPADAGKILSDCVIDYMRKLGMPNGLAAVGYNSDDIPKMVEAVYPQMRLTSLSPRPAGKDDLQQIFEDAMSYW
jgi:hydroxyacid-oxoacid transhydrogenase